MPVAPQVPDGRVTVAFILEQPGTEDYKYGRPFSGNTGAVFRQIMRTAGLNEEDFYIDYVFNDKLPEGAWVKAPTARAEGFIDALPPSALGYLRPEHHHFLDSLRDRLLVANPVVIVPLGGVPFWAFSGEASVEKFRGSVQRAERIVAGAKLLPSYHPGDIRKVWKLFSVAVGDIRRAVAEADRGPEIFHPTRRLAIRPRFPSEVRGWLDERLPCPLLSVDIETGWGQITSIGFATSTEDAICIPFVDLDKPNKSYWDTAEEEIEVLRIIDAVLRDPSIPKLGQNFAQYDLLWLWERYGMEVWNLSEDTRLMHHAVYPELPKDLAFLGASYTEQGPWKAMTSHRKLTVKTDKKDD